MHSFDGESLSEDYMLATDILHERWAVTQLTGEILAELLPDRETR